MTDRSNTSGLACPKDGKALLDDYFLEIRSHLLEAASGLDRIERAQAGQEALADPRARKLLESLKVLQTPGADRARQFLALFSEPS